MVVQAIRVMTEREVMTRRAMGTDIVMSPWAFDKLSQLGVTQRMINEGVTIGLDPTQDPCGFVGLTPRGKVQIERIQLYCNFLFEDLKQ